MDSAICSECEGTNCAICLRVFSSGYMVGMQDTVEFFAEPRKTSAIDSRSKLFDELAGYVGEKLAHEIAGKVDLPE